MTFRGTDYKNGMEHLSATRLGPFESRRRAVARAAMTPVDLDRLSAHGGSIAVGHPYGTTGARIARNVLNGPTSRDTAMRTKAPVHKQRLGMAILTERLS